MIDIEQILARMLAEVGGEETLRSLTSVDLAYDIEVGTLSGKVHSRFDVAGRRYLHEVDYGAFTVSDGFNGEVTWKVDHNGKLRVRSEADRARERLSVDLTFHRYLIDREQFRVRASRHGELIRLHVSTVADADHPTMSAVVDIDPETAHILRRETSLSGHAVVEIFHAHQYHDGLLVGTMVTHIDAAGNEARLALSSVRLNGPLDEGAFGPPSRDVVDYRFLDGVTRTRVPIRVPLDHIYADVEIAGRRWTFIVDTGAGATVISTRLKEALGLEGEGKLMAQGVGGGQEFEFVRVSEIRIGQAALIDQRVVAMDLAEVESRLQRLDGILGMDFLTRFVVKLDYVAGEMEVFDRDEFRYDGPGETISIDRSYIHASFDGHEGSFQIDTGAGSLHIHAPFVSRFGMVTDPDRMPSMTALSGVGTVELTKYLALCHEVRIGGHVLRDVPIGLARTGEGSFSNAAIMGNIGGVIWRKFIIHFDFDAETIHIEPNVNFDEPFPRSMLGATLRRQGGELMVDAVVRNSPAWRHGIAPGDLLVTVDGEPMDGRSAEEISAWFRRPAGTPMTLLLRRDGIDREVALLLADFHLHYDAYGTEAVPDHH